MNVPRFRAHVAGGLCATATAFMGLALTVAPSVAEGASSGTHGSVRPVANPSPRQPGGHTVLTCTVSTSSAQPITADPAVTMQPRMVTARGTLMLTDCTSPDNSFPGVRSGELTFQGSGQATCTGVENITGTGTITWNNAQGKSAGTDSTVRPNLDPIDSYDPGGMMLVGEVTGGKLKGTRIAGMAIPTSDISPCSDKGLSSIQLVTG